MSVIDRTIWLIESALTKPIGLDELAENAGVSRSHLSRMFPAATGYPLFGYLRARRLTEAAKALVAGAPDILALALDAGYSSHEAFTRAFGDLFGLTPDELRRRGTIRDLALVEPLPMSIETNTTVTPPVIERRAAMRFAGLIESIQMADPSGFAALWQKFGPHLGHVPGGVGRVAYGIVASYDDENCRYMAGVEVTSSAIVPSDLAELSVPALTWARFAHSGHISTIRSTIRAVFDVWLQESGRRLTEGINFLEFYGEDFNPITGLGTCEIWIALAE